MTEREPYRTHSAPLGPAPTPLGPSPALRPPTPIEARAGSLALLVLITVLTGGFTVLVIAGVYRLVVEILP